MEEQFISAADFCEHYHIEYSFITSLEESGLIETTKVDGKPFIDHENITELEKFARLHYDLDIELHGIEAIIPLLTRIQQMRNEIIELRSRLRLYEE